MHIGLGRFIIATLAVLIMFGVQFLVQKRVLNTNVRRYWNEKAEDSVKLVRQDVGGLVAGISITNALLAAILAVLIFG
jgi:predicted PurR-regulated permease PerM